MTESVIRHLFGARTGGLQPWDHQVADIQKLLANPRYGLFAEPGLGKTFTALTAIAYQWPGPVGPKMVWVGPRISLPQIREDIVRFFPEADVVTLGTANDALWVNEGEGNVYLVTPDLLARTPIREALASAEWDYIVIDEAHRFKTDGALRTKALFGEDGIIQRSQPAHVWCLSGTPMPNGLPGELYPMFRCLWPEKTEVRYWNYRRRYHKIRQMRVGQGSSSRLVHRDVGVQNLAQWRSKYGEHFTRRRLEDHLDLDRPIIKDTLLEAQHLPLERLWSATQTATADDALQVLSDAEIATAMRATGLLKVGAAVQLVVGLIESGAQRALVGVWHRDVAETLNRDLDAAGVPCAAITGDTPKAQAEQALKDFQSCNTPCALVGQLIVMGEAINLQCCHHIVLVEPSWVPGVNRQFIGRCWRGGQRNRVIVHSVSLSGSPDEGVTRALTRKLRDEINATT